MHVAVSALPVPLQSLPAPPRCRRRHRFDTRDVENHLIRPDASMASSVLGVRSRMLTLAVRFGCHAAWFERFQAKWIPVRVKQTRQNKNLERNRDSIRWDCALGRIHRKAMG